MADKKVTMELTFKADMPPMPAQGYGVGSPANSNQNLWAYDQVAGGSSGSGRINSKGVVPQQWADRAQTLADFHLSRGRSMNEGWGGFGGASDLTHHMFTAQGRYQASIPGTAAHANVEAYKSSKKDAESERREQVIGHLDKFAGNLQTAATSLAYLTGASGGLTSALNRAGSVFAAFQGVSGLLGMGGGSVGSVAQGIGSVIGGGGARALGMGAAGVAGMGIAGIAAAGSFGPMGSHVPNRGQTFGGAISEQFFGVGEGYQEGRNRNVLAGFRADWNRSVVNSIGGGRVNDRGMFISQEQQQQLLNTQLGRRIESFQGSQALASQQLGLMGQRQSVQQGYDYALAQYGGYEGYASSMDTGSKSGGRVLQQYRALSEQPASMVGIMNQIYGNNFQAQGELASRLQGVQEQARGFASQGLHLDANMSQVGLKKSSLQKQLQEVKAHGSQMTELYGKDSGGATESRQRAVEIQQQLNSLVLEENNIRKQMRDVDTSILEARRQQAMASSQMLQGVINQEKQGQDQSAMQFGRLDPGERQYVKGVLERYDKGGRKDVAPDEMHIVEQYRRREAEKDYREIAKEEGFSDKGTLRDKAIQAAEGELGKQQGLVLELSRQLDVKLEMDNKALAEILKKELGPQITNVVVTMNEIAGKLIQITEGMNQLQAAQRASGK